MCFENVVSREYVAFIRQDKWSGHDYVRRGNWSFRLYDTTDYVMDPKNSLRLSSSIYEVLRQERDAQEHISCKKSSRHT